MKKYFTREELRVRSEQLIENPVERVPICICICAGKEITAYEEQKLNTGINTLIQSLRENEDTVDAAEICIVVASNGEVKVMNEFMTTDYYDNTITVKAEGDANTPAGLQMALDKLEERVAEYKYFQCAYYQPWLIVLCKGNEEQHGVLGSFADEIQAKIEGRHINMVPVALDQEARTYLKSIGKKGKVYSLADMKYDAFFEWIAKSAESMSASLSGAMQVEIPTQSWEEFF